MYNNSLLKYFPNIKTLRKLKIYDYIENINIIDNIDYRQLENIKLKLPIKIDFETINNDTYIDYKYNNNFIEMEYDDEIEYNDIPINIINKIRSFIKKYYKHHNNNIIQYFNIINSNNIDQLDVKIILQLFYNPIFRTITNRYIQYIKYDISISF
jgi:hypothetical protein